MFIAFWHLLSLPPYGAALVKTPQSARCFPPFPVLEPAQNSNGDQAGDGAIRVSWLRSDEV